MLRIGVVGCGYWGSKHVRVLAGIPDVSVVAIDASAARLIAVRDASGPKIELVDNLGDALPRLDAVVIATPPETHFHLALQALLAGKHVLVEKPLTTTSTDVRRLIEAAEQRDRTLMVGHTFVYNPAVTQLRSIVQSGELGRVFHLDTARLNLGLYQQNVDVIWDLAPHDISILNFVLGRGPNSIRAWGGRYAHRSCHDVAYLQLDYGGIGAQVHVSWLEPRKVRRVTVVGSAKMAVFNDLAEDERLRVYDKGVVSEIDPSDPLALAPAYRNGGVFSPYVPFDEPLKLEDLDFVCAITTGRSPIATAESGLEVVRVLEAASRALRTGATVETAELVEVSAG